MVKPTSITINKTFLIVLIIILILLNSIWFDYKNKNLKLSVNSSEILNDEQNNVNQANIQTDVDVDNSARPNWIIEIPEIDLIAEIGEGTASEVMDKYVGHFEETKIEYGNIGLAAHNRGYPVNYFQDLKKLKMESEITYKHGDFEMTYVVKKIEIIENTDWSYLENTEDNRITLITCVENEPKYRRCIQGIEKIESEEF